MTRHSEPSSDDLRDASWGEFAAREGYGYTDVYSALAFDGGWATALESPMVKRAQAEAWSSGLNTGIGYKTALDVVPFAPEPENPYVENEGAGAHD